MFRGFWADVFNTKYVMKLPLGYLPGTARGARPIEPATARKYLWSFVGQLSKSSRPDMAKALLPVEPHFLFSTDATPGLIFLNQIDGKPRRLSFSDTAQVLQQSAFAPCPMGNVHAECFRVYEALEAGSIPILEKRMTLDYFRDLLGPHPMPTFRSWDQAREMIRGMLRDASKIDALQNECIDWWASYKRSYIEQVGRIPARAVLRHIPHQRTCYDCQVFASGLEGDRVTPASRRQRRHSQSAAAGDSLDARKKVPSSVPAGSEGGIAPS